MKVWSIESWIGREFADLYPYYIETGEFICKDCNYEKINKSLEAHWEEGSDKIGDFTAAIGRLVVKEKIADDLLTKFSGFEKVEVVFHENPRRNKSTKKYPLVTIPYKGPNVVEMWINCEIEFHSKSSIEIEEQCETCGSKIYKEFYGIEECDSKEHIKRIPGKGFFFNYDDLKGNSIFKPKDTGFILCTDEVKNYIESCKYTNVYFCEVGEFI